jgi:hypothetical protein
LCLYRRLKRIARRMERNAKRIADDLKNVTVVRFHGEFQNVMVTLTQCFPLIGVLLCESGCR